LSGRFYAEIVAPAIAPIPHAAALIGYGSDVLGYDTARSTDHGWGPRLVVTVDASDVKAVQMRVGAALPETFRGWPVGYDRDGNPGPHQVTITALGTWLARWLGHNPLVGMTTADWLTTPQQLLLGVVRGAVYHDDDGALTGVREQLAYLPPTVRMWMLACQWRRIDQEEPFVGRTAEVDDETGSRILAGRQVRALMHLHFLLVGEYWPYSKWLGTAYRALPGAAEFVPIFETALAATDHATREDALVAAYEAMARLHNATGLTDAVDATVRNFYDRPFRVLASDRFVQACLARVDDEGLRTLPLVGSVDQFVDSTDVLAYAHVVRRLRGVYDGL
jgi:hypothetical protein